MGFMDKINNLFGDARDKVADVVEDIVGEPDTSEEYEADEMTPADEEAGQYEADRPFGADEDDAKPEEADQVIDDMFDPDNAPETDDVVDADVISSDDEGLDSDVMVEETLHEPERPADFDDPADGISAVNLDEVAHERESDPLAHVDETNETVVFTEPADEPLEHPADEESDEDAEYGISEMSVEDQLAEPVEGTEDDEDEDPDYSEEVAEPAVITPGADSVDPNEPVPFDGDLPDEDEYDSTRSVI